MPTNQPSTSPSLTLAIVVSTLLFILAAGWAISLWLTTSSTKAPPVSSAESKSPTADGSDHAPQIRSVLDQLLESGEGSFVYVEVEGKRWFVQFAGSLTEPLYLDLPITQLTADESTRAEAFFASIPGSEKGNQSFGVRLSRDTAAAAKLALRTLKEVYHADPAATLKITLHSE